MRIEELSPSERAVWEGFPRGETVDLSDRPPEERLVRAEVIRLLLLGARDAEPGHVAAVRLAGARIAGPLNLGHATVEMPLALTGCDFSDAPHLYWARLRSVHLMRCRLPGLVASGARVDGHLWLEGSQVNGGVWVDGSHVTGIFNLSGAHLLNAGGDALLADRLTVDANVYCDNGFTAEGEVRLPGATVGGQLILRGARLRNPSGAALYASRLSVAANMFCDSGFSAEGEIRLRGARVGGYLSFVGATLTSPDGTALNGDDLAVETDVYCSEGFSSEGGVSFAGARVGGQLSLQRARLANPEGIALGLQRLQAEELLLRPSEPFSGLVDLSYARLGLLRDDPETWPPALELDGLTYDMIEPPLTARQRLGWLLRDVGGYLPQPYERLAQTYRSLGHDAEGRAVLLAKQRRRRSTQPLTRRVWGYLQDAAVGYGYRPLRALNWLFALLVFGTVFFHLDEPPPLNTDAVPHFNPFFYTLDLLLPVGSLGQESEFSPDTGVSQFASNALIAAGFILGLTVAAGITRVLSRD